MLTKLYMLGKAPFLSAERRMLFLKLISGGDKVDRYLINEDRDYILFGGVRIIVKKAPEKQ